MNRNIVISIVLAAAAGSSFADDISIDTTPFTSSATRAEVRADLNAFKQSGVNPWSNQYNPLTQFKGQSTRAEVTAEYIASRDEVAAFTGQDSGSSYLSARGDDAPVAVPFAGQPRNPQ